MFESAELGHRIDKRTYDRDLPKVRYSLLEAQLRVQERSEFPVIVVVGGEDGSGRGDLVNHLLEWMDPHHVRVHPTGTPVDGAEERPPMWRYWRSLRDRARRGWPEAPARRAGTGARR